MSQHQTRSHMRSYSHRDFFAIYAQAQVTPTTTKPSTSTTKPKPTTPSTSCGYIEYMMGQCQLSTTTTTPLSNPFSCQTGNTVYLNLVDLGNTSFQTYVMDVYLDGVYVGRTDTYGHLSITCVTPGYHTFSLKNSWGTFVTDPISIPNYYFTLRLSLRITY